MLPRQAHISGSTFDGQQAQLGSDASAGGKASGSSTRGQYAMTRHDDRIRIARHGLPDAARSGAITASGSDLSIGECLTRGNAPNDVVHLLEELWDSSHIEFGTAADRDARLPAAPRCHRCSAAPIAARRAPQVALPPCLRSRRDSVADSLHSGSCTATMPCDPQIRPQLPMAVGNNM